ncbi:MAG: hypothetical protein ACFCVD_07425 [Nodosilinea sp.]
MVLKPQGMRVGTMTICGTIGGDHPKHQSEQIAEQYWRFYVEPSDDIEVMDEVMD